VILYGQTSLAYRSGQRLDRPIVARVDFTWDNPIKAAREQDVARRGTPNYYRLNSELIAEVEKDLQALTQALAESPSYEEFQARIKGAARPARGGGATASSGWNFSESAYEQLHRLASEQGEQWRAICGELTRTLASAPVIWSTPAEQRQPKSLVLEPVVFDPTSPDQRKRFLTYVYDLGSRGQMDDAVRAILAGLPPSLNEDVRKGFREYLVGLFAPHGLSGPMRAVYVYDAVETQQRMELAAKAVSPTEAYTRGQTLVQADSTITETMLDLLRAERAAYTEKLRTDPVLHHGYVLHQIGLCGVVLATVLALAVYTLGYRPQVLRSLVQTSELLLVLLAGVVICRWIATSNLAYADRWAIVPVWLIGFDAGDRHAAAVRDRGDVRGSAAGGTGAADASGGRVRAAGRHDAGGDCDAGGHPDADEAGDGGGGGGPGGVRAVGFRRPGDDAAGRLRRHERAGGGPPRRWGPACCCTDCCRWWSGSSASSRA
jgi:hypothetical protein